MLFCFYFVVAEKRVWSEHLPTVVGVMIHDLLLVYSHMHYLFSFVKAHWIGRLKIDGSIQAHNPYNNLL